MVGTIRDIHRMAAIRRITGRCTTTISHPTTVEGILRTMEESPLITVEGTLRTMAESHPTTVGNRRIMVAENRQTTGAVRLTMVVANLRAAVVVEVNRQAVEAAVVANLRVVEEAATLANNGRFAGT